MRGEAWEATRDAEGISVVVHVSIVPKEGVEVKRKKRKLRILV